MCCPTGSSALSLDFQCLKAWSVCVLRAHAHICHPTSHVEQLFCFPMQILFQANWFYHKGFLCSRRWVSACCKFILARHHLYFCMLQGIGTSVEYKPLLPVIFKFVCIFISVYTVCIVTTEECSRCSVACGLVSIGCLWGILPAVDSASID